MAFSPVLVSESAMTLRRATTLLALGGALLLSQFATRERCSAAEAAKNDQKIVDPTAQRPPEGMLPTALLSLNADHTVFSQFAFLVDKSTRTLTVWQNDGEKIKLIGAWPADIGRNAGDKVAEGDAKTPEGVYFFQTSRDGRKLDYQKYGVRVFTMDYPNYFDRLEKKTGTGIWLHAISDDQSLLRGSRGCVVVRNQVIEELGKFIELKRTPIVVVDRVVYLADGEWLKEKAKLGAWLDGWRQAWAGKDLDKYMELYSDRFRSGHMNKESWRRYKKNLGDRYQFIDVSLRDVQIFNQGPKVVFRFLQDYKSDRKQDYGAKLLYAMKEGDRFAIVGESWEPLSGEGEAMPKAASTAASPASPAN